jgi:ABC1 atypical kinase-like domain
MNACITQYGTFVNGCYYPPGEKVVVDGTFYEGYYCAHGKLPHRDLGRLPVAEAAEHPFERVVRRIEELHCPTIFLPELCATKHLKDFSREELNRLLEALGLTGLGSLDEMITVDELFGNSIFGDNAAIEALRLRMTFGPLIPPSKCIKLFSNDQVHGCKAMWGGDKVRFLKIATCDADNNLVIFIREAVIQFYLATRFLGKIPRMYAIYMTDYSRRPGVDTETPHFVFEMEYVEGGSLHDAIRKGILDPVTGTRRPLTVTDIRRIVGSVSEMLEEMQDAVGLVHNDLHTGNVCIKANGSVMLIDCGHTTLHSKWSVGTEKVIGGDDIDFHFPAYLCPTIRKKLSSAAQGGAANLVKALWPKMQFDKYYRRCYSVSLQKQADLDVNPSVRGGDLFYFVYNILSDLFKCHNHAVTGATYFPGTNYKGMCDDLFDLFQFGRHLNVFDVIHELNQTGQYAFIAYFASKDRAVLESLFPGVPSVMIDMVMRKFLPENIRMIYGII